MTEYKCGSADTCQFGKMCKPNYDIDICYLYKAEEPLTNEKWMHTLNTEQFADKLTDFSFWLVPTIPTEDKREQIRKRIEIWLKEIHKE